jgi:hypothetical protein
VTLACFGFFILEVICIVLAYRYYKKNSEQQQQFFQRYNAVRDGQSPDADSQENHLSPDPSDPDWWKR